MASTLTPTPFNVKITEEQVVRNTIVKSEVSFTIENVTNVDRRVVTCPQSTSIALFNVNGINPGQREKSKSWIAQCVNLSISIHILN